MSESLLQAQQLFCERDDRVLFSELSFSLSSGEIVQIQGRNGAGKSTLLKILSGLYSAFEGRVLYRDDSQSSGTALLSQDLCFIGHRLPVKKHLSAQENLRYYTSLTGDWSEAEAVKAFKDLGLLGYEDCACSDLSAGQQRRVALARLWLTNSKVLILDEPFTALDIEAVTMLERFLEQAAKSGKLVIFTSHHIARIQGLRSIALGKEVMA